MHATLTLRQLKVHYKIFDMSRNLQSMKKTSESTKDYNNNLYPSNISYEKYTHAIYEITVYVQFYNLNFEFCFCSTEFHMSSNHFS